MGMFEDNIAKLPEICYGTLNTTEELILLKRGEAGYYPTQGYTANEHCSFDQLADTLNERLGVTLEQRFAMEFGTMFGFDVPGANPDLFKKDAMVKKLDGVDKTLGDKARDLVSAGYSFEEMTDFFKDLIAMAAPLREEPS